MVMIHEYRHIKGAKRRGRGHFSSGIEGTSTGELIIPCRACPHPGVNLPERWEQAPPEMRLFSLGPLIIKNLTLVRFLYAVFLAVDANFKHKSRLRVTKAKLLAQKAQAEAVAQGLPEVEEVIDAKDVALGPGWGCFVDNGPYMEHLRAQPDQNEAGHFLDLIFLC